MNDSGASAQVNANVNVQPTYSQVLLVMVVLASTIAVICSTYLFATDKPVAGSLLLVFAALAILLVSLAWLKSQPDIDMGNAHPTCIALPDGTNIKTDSRTLRNIEGVRGMTRILDEMMNRKPLPAPIGLVNENIQPIPDTQAEAIALTNQINEMSQANTNTLIDALGLGDSLKDESTLNLTRQVADVTNQGPKEALTKKLNIESEGDVG